MNWPEVSLGEICRPKQHKTIPKSELLDQGFVVYGANGPIGYYSDFTHDRTTIAVTCRGATCGTINVVPPKSYITGNAMALDDLDEERVDLSFLRYTLEQQGFDSVINGAAQPQITRAPLLKYTLPLPPLEEQKRLAAILDQADALRRLRQRALDRLDILGKAWFHQHQRSLVGENTTLGEVCAKITDGTHQSPKWTTSGVPFLFVSNIRNQEIDFETEKFISEQTYDELTRNTKVESGDVLYTSVGSYGHAAVVPEGEKFLFQRHIAHLKPNPDLIDSHYLMYLLESPSLRHQADVGATGIAQKTVTLSLLKRMEAIIPPLSVQKALAAKLKKMTERKITYLQSLSSLNELFASLQSRAFKGEL